MQDHVGQIRGKKCFHPFRGISHFCYSGSYRTVRSLRQERNGTKDSATVAVAPRKYFIKYFFFFGFLTIHYYLPLYSWRRSAEHGTNHGDCGIRWEITLIDFYLFRPSNFQFPRRRYNNILLLTSRDRLRVFRLEEDRRGNFKIKRTLS